MGFLLGFFVFFFFSSVSSSSIFCEKGREQPVSMYSMLGSSQAIVGSWRETLGQN